MQVMEADNAAFCRIVCQLSVGYRRLYGSRSHLAFSWLGGGIKRFLSAIKIHGWIL